MQPFRNVEIARMSGGQLSPCSGSKLQVKTPDLKVTSESAQRPDDVLSGEPVSQAEIEPEGDKRLAAATGGFA